MAVEGAGLSAVAVRRSQPRGWWGALLFVATEAALFGCLIGTALYLRAKAPHWPPLGTKPPELLWPLVLTGVLVLTAVPVRLAPRARTARRAQALLALAFLGQAVYLGIELHRYAGDLRDDPPQSSAYASITHLLTGASHFHVFVGLLVDLFLLLKLADGRLTHYRATGLRAAALYWTFVAVLTVVVTGVELSAR